MCFFLLVLDMSAAFDTVDHTVLLKRLSDHLGIQGQAIKCIAFHLGNRKQFVVNVVQGRRSEQQELDCNVPQGSVLGSGLLGHNSSPVCDIF